MARKRGMYRRGRALGAVVGTVLALGVAAAVLIERTGRVRELRAEEALRSGSLRAARTARDEALANARRALEERFEADVRARRLEELARDADPARRARLLEACADLVRAAEDGDGSLAAAEAGLAGRETEPELVADLALVLALVRLDGGDPAAAQSLLELALERNGGARGRGHPATLDVLERLAALHRDHGRPEAAEPLARELVRRTPDGDAARARREALLASLRAALSTEDPGGGGE